MPEAFDFDAWAELAARDPAAFESARCRAVARVIGAAGNDPERLRRLQWRVNMERRRTRTPLKACLVLSGMMWEAFTNFRDVLNGFLEPPGEIRRELRLVSSVTDTHADDAFAGDGIQGPGQ